MKPRSFQGHNRNKFKNGKFPPLFLFFLLKYTMRVINTIARGGCAISILGGVQDSGEDPEQHALLFWFYAAGWTGWPLSSTVPPNLNYSMN